MCRGFFIMSILFVVCLVVAVLGLIGLLLIEYLKKRNNAVYKFRKKVINDSRRENGVLMPYGKLPSYNKMLLSFKPLKKYLK